MITIILVMVLVCFIGLFFYYKTKGVIDDLAAFLTIPLCLFGLMLGCTFAFSIDSDVEKREYTTEIVSLQDNSSIEGKSYFLGYGYVKGTMVYTFYTKNGDMYELQKIDHDLVKIKYTDGNPKLVMIREELTDSWKNYFSAGHTPNKRYVIHVPKGTIINDFKLDAK